MAVLQPNRVLLIGVAATLCSTMTAQAQFYGGGGFGAGYPEYVSTGLYQGPFAPTLNYPGYGFPGGGYGYSGGTYFPGAGLYSNGNASGAYPFNNWYVGPYRSISPGFVGAGGYGYTTNYGSRGFATGYGLPVFSPMVVEPSPVYAASNVPYQSAVGGAQVITPANSAFGLQASAYRSPGISPSNTARTGKTIKLACPKSAVGSLTYVLNGELYTMQPGFSQSFLDDRIWTLEFKRGDENSETVSYTLKPGKYNFAVGGEGWELREVVAQASVELPPAPLPDLSPIATPGPTPQSPQ